MPLPRYRKSRESSDHHQRNDGTNQRQLGYQLHASRSPIKKMTNSATSPRHRYFATLHTAYYDIDGRLPMSRYTPLGVFKSSRTLSGPLFKTVYFAFCVGQPLVAYSSGPQRPAISFEEYSSALLSQNPDAQDEDLRIEGAELRAEGASILPDPIFQISK